MPSKRVIRIEIRMVEIHSRLNHQPLQAFLAIVAFPSRPSILRAVMPA
jgi:hypothetical protein